MNSLNFSWGIIGFIVTIVTSVGAIVGLAFAGYTDPTVIAALGLLASNALVALSAVMNPSRKMQDEVNEIAALKNELAYHAGEVKKEVDSVKKILK